MSDAGVAWSRSFAGGDDEALRAYDRVLVPPVFSRWAEILVDGLPIAELPADARILDVACGTGALTRVLARRFGPAARVLGVDLSPGMIGLAGRYEPEPGAAAIDYRVASATDLAVPDASFDVLTCQHGLQFVDLAAACAELRRAAAPGARLAVATWAPLAANPMFVALHAALVDTLGAAAGAAFAAPWSLSPDRVVDALAAAGFADLRSRRQVLRVVVPGGFADLAQTFRFTGVAPLLAGMSGGERGRVFAAARHRVAPLVRADGAVVSDTAADLVYGRRTG